MKCSSTLTAYAITDLEGRMKSRTIGGGDRRRSLGSQRIVRVPDNAAEVKCDMRRWRRDLDKRI
ncbi:unnamed protein product [Prunus armeniaca]